MKLLGRVLWWDARDREGVITGSDGIEYYFNYSTFPDHSKYRTIEGRFVEFEKNDKVRNSHCARRVKVLPASSQSKARKSFERLLKNNEAAVV